MQRTTRQSPRGRCKQPCMSCRRAVSCSCQLRRSAAKRAQKASRATPHAQRSQRSAPPWAARTTCQVPVQPLHTMAAKHRRTTACSTQRWLHRWMQKHGRTPAPAPRCSTRCMTAPHTLRQSGHCARSRCSGTWCPVTTPMAAPHRCRWRSCQLRQQRIAPAACRHSCCWQCPLLLWRTSSKP